MKIVSWNIEGRLSRFAECGHRGSPEQIVQVLQRLDGDLVFLPEAFDEDRQIEPEIMNQIKNLGYEIIEVAYDGIDSREYAATVNPYMMFLSRLNVKKSQKIRLGDSRNMLVVDVTEPITGQTIRIFGIHLDDRGEQNRLLQVDDLLPHISASPFPTVAMGDFNAMHGVSLTARILRNNAVLSAISILPHPPIRDQLKRLSEMAIGSTLKQIQSKTSLRDADNNNRPTTTPKMRGQEWMPSIRLAQIDHVLVSSYIEVSNFTVAPDGGSDHRAITAEIGISGQNNPPVL